MENTKKIGERVYTFGMLMPEESIRVQVAVARVIGEPLFAAFVSAKGEDDAAVAEAGKVAIGLLLTKMDADELITTVGRVFKQVGITPGEGYPQGKAAITMNGDFVGKPKEVWLVFAAALRFNFSDFLPAKLLASAQGLVKKASE